MNNQTVNLLDLPDELLLIIFNKLGSADVIYSLLNSTQRLDRIVRSIDYTKAINLSEIDSDKIDRFCVELLPQIHDRIRIMTLESSSIERILCAAQFPHLNSIALVGFSPDVLLHYFKSESSMTRLFKEQIRSVTVKIRNKTFNNETYTDVCECILSVCKECIFLDMDQFGIIKCSKLSLKNVSRKLFYSSYLQRLSVYVETFDDCLCLLDGRLENLSSLTVRVFSLSQLSTVNDSKKKLLNLKEFSLTCYRLTVAYDCRIVRLLHRMINLKKLSLSLNVVRLTVIDGVDLNEKILRYLSSLQTFVFDICTILPPYEAKSLLSTKDLEKTFTHWKYSQVNCSVDQYSNGLTYYHVYSIPYKMTHFMFLTNTIRNQNQYFEFVITLVLYDDRPFEHDSFEWISKAVPRLKYLTIEISAPQLKQKKETSISYNHLTRLRVIKTNIDYVYQFLCHTKAHVPQLNVIEIQYDQLFIVTNDFSSPATRINCSQLKELRFREAIVYPQHFHDYFPSLLINSNMK